MKATPYDIFRKDLLGTPVWMESAEDLETAEGRMMELARRSPAEYFVFSQETREIVSDTTPRLADLVPKAGVLPNSVRQPGSAEFSLFGHQLPKLCRILSALVVQLS